MTHTPPPVFNNPHPVHQTILARWFPGVRLSVCTPLRMAGMLPVLVVLGIHVLSYVTAVPGTLIPLSSAFPFTTSVMLVVFHLIFILTVANYLLLVIIDPGSTPEDWKAPSPTTFFRPSPLSQHLSHSTLRTPPQPLVSSNSNVPSQTSLSVKQPPAVSNTLDLPQLVSTSISDGTNFRYAHLMHERTYEGYLRYCRFCKAYKPDRAHHCSVCKRCILRMDHHCVFVNNCISFYNHKFFIAFVTYAFLGCVIVSVVSFPTFVDIISLPKHSSVLADNGMGQRWSRFVILLIKPWRMVAVLIDNHAIPNIIRLSMSQFSAASKLPNMLKTAVMIGYIVSSAFAFALGVFVTLHFFLLSKGRTTIEMYEMTDPVRAPLVAQYDLGFSQNVRTVCGSVLLCWLCPTRAFIDGDGIRYERRDTTRGEDSAV